MKSLKKITLFLLAVALIFTVIFMLNSSNSTVVSLQPNREMNSDYQKSDIPADFFPKTLHILAIGDSLTKGVGDTTNKGGYLNYLQKHLETLKEIKDVEITNLGITGQRSDQLLKRLKLEEVQKSIQESDMVFITIGGNDLMKIVKNNFTNLQVDVFEDELDNYQNRLNSILSEVKNVNPSATVVLLGVYNPFSDMFGDIDEFQLIVNEWNDASLKIVNQYENTIFVNISKIFAETDSNLLYEDHFHPNNKGYKLIAKEVFKTLKEYRNSEEKDREEEVAHE